MDHLLQSTDLYECYCWQNYTTVSNTDLYLSYFDLSYVFPGHNDSVKRGLTVVHSERLLFLSHSSWLCHQLALCTGKYMSFPFFLSSCAIYKSKAEIFFGQSYSFEIEQTQQMPFLESHIDQNVKPFSSTDNETKIIWISILILLTLKLNYC